MYLLYFSFVVYLIVLPWYSQFQFFGTPRSGSFPSLTFSSLCLLFFSILLLHSSPGKAVGRQAIWIAKAQRGIAWIRLDLCYPYSLG